MVNPFRIRLFRVSMEAVLLLAAMAAVAPVSLHGASANSLPSAAPLIWQLPATQPASAQPTPEEEGDTMLGYRRYQAAIEAYKRAPQDSAAIWNKMGLAYQLLYNTEDAERCYKKAIKLDRRNATAINNLGSLALLAKKYSTAEKLYKKAVKLDPKNSLYRKNLGTAYLADHRYRQGWQAYRAALVIDPNIFSHSSGVSVGNPVSAHERGALNYYMARGCLLAGKPQQAIEYLRRAINEGFITPQKLISDSEFATLHNLPAFHQLMEANAEHH